MSSVLPLAPPPPTSVRPRTDLAPHLADLRAALDEQRSFRLEQMSELTTLLRHQTGEQARVLLAVRRGAVTALADIDTALRLLDTGEYGRCRVCQAALPLSRLEVLPAATLCMECQREHECAAG